MNAELLNREYLDRQYLNRGNPYSTMANTRIRPEARTADADTFLGLSGNRQRATLAGAAVLGLITAVVGLTLMGESAASLSGKIAAVVTVGLVLAFGSDRGGIPALRNRVGYLPVALGHVVAMNLPARASWISCPGVWRLQPASKPLQPPPGASKA